MILNRLTETGNAQRFVTSFKSLRILTTESNTSSNNNNNSSSDNISLPEKISSPNKTSSPDNTIAVSPRSPTTQPELQIETTTHTHNPSDTSTVAMSTEEPNIPVGSDEMVPDGYAVNVPTKREVDTFESLIADVRYNFMNGADVPAILSAIEDIKLCTDIGIPVRTLDAGERYEAKKEAMLTHANLLK